MFPPFSTREQHFFSTLQQLDVLIPPLRPKKKHPARKEASQVEGTFLLCAVRPGLKCQDKDYLLGLFPIIFLDVG